MADPKGVVKCQESAQLQVSDLFSDDELANFETFVEEVGFEPDQMGWRLSPCQSRADCPSAGDLEENSPLVMGNIYTNNATCVFAAATKRPPPPLWRAAPDWRVRAHLISCWGTERRLASRRCPGGGRPHSVARQG